jgi:hypothetical protein
MMRLSDVRDYIASLGLAESVYQSKMDGKKEKSIGVYNSKHSNKYETAIGGPDLKSYGVKYITLLVHWNKSPRDTENTAMGLFERLEKVQEVNINNETIKFIQLLNDGPVDVGTDDAGIYEMVIEMAVVYKK